MKFNLFHLGDSNSIDGRKPKDLMTISQREDDNPDGLQLHTRHSVESTVGLLDQADRNEYPYNDRKWSCHHWFPRVSMVRKEPEIFHDGDNLRKDCLSWQLSQKSWKVSQPIYSDTTWKVTLCALIGLDTTRHINNRPITEKK